MTNIDNINLKLGDDLKKELNSSSKLKLCAAYFSIYAFDELKKELENIKEFSFIFNSPTFLKEELKKEKKEFFIPPFIREKTIAGGEFEIKLRNGMSQKSIAKECRDWIEKKCKFKTLKNNIRTNNGLFIENEDKNIVYANFDSFTADGLGYEKNSEKIFPIYPKIEEDSAKQYIKQFDQIWNNKDLVIDVTDRVINYITSVHKENSPEYLYFITLYNIFNEFLEDINEDNIANEKTGFKETTIWNTLYNFQKDAVLGAINKLEKYNGCIIADSVGLGKTFTALGIIKYYELKNKDVLVLCPKRLSDNWNNFISNYKTNLLQKDRFRYDVLYHSDLSRDKGKSNGIDLSLINWGNYDLVVIDESHNFRNNDARADRETRYQKLMRKIIKSGVKTKVLMLSATPVNNKFNDLKNQLALAYEGDSDIFNKNINLTKSVDKVFSDAQKAFNDWSNLDVESRTSGELLNSLNFDFFQVLDAVTIARSRKHITKYYDTSEIGGFPIKNKPINQDFELTDIENFMSFKDIFEHLSAFNLSIYTPFRYILPQKIDFYENKYDTKVRDDKSSLKQSTRETGILKLMRVNLLKRLESSAESFRLTLNRLNQNIKITLDAIDNFNKSGINKLDGFNISDVEEEDMDENFMVGDKIQIDLNDVDVLSWERDLKKDFEIINKLLEELNKITPEKDSKLNSLINLIENKINNPINEDNKKVVVFSAFADTVNYIYEHISKYFKEKYNLNSASITGSGSNKVSIKVKQNEMNHILTLFSPISKKRDLIGMDHTLNIDILIATDCISEGQNLQDCDYLINYDIHWNPVRIIQRFGRIDRIGSINKQIQLVNFWPPVDLDDYINLRARVESRMHALNLTATGEENLLNNESSDLEYRKKQLIKLRDEVVDMEDMDNGISITDLGLNDFRIDLINFISENGEIKNVPFGLHAVVPKREGIEPGVIFVLKNLNNGVNINNINKLHPFYLVYISENNEIISNHVNVKQTLDIFRVLTKGKIEPDFKITDLFNKETKDGSKMEKYSHLLHQSIESVINVKEDLELNSLFKSGGTSIGREKIKGLEDFELICFLIIK